MLRIREFLPSPLVLSICRLLVTSTLAVNCFNSWSSFCIQEPLKVRKSWSRWYPAISQHCDLSRTEGNEKEKDGNVPWGTWCVSLWGSENGSGHLRKTSRTMLPVGGFLGLTLLTFGGFGEMRRHTDVSCSEPHPAGLEVGRWRDVLWPWAEPSL